MVSAACILSWVEKRNHLLKPPVPIEIEIMRPYQGAGVFLGAEGGALGEANAEVGIRIIPGILVLNSLYNHGMCVPQTDFKMV